MEGQEKIPLCDVVGIDKKLESVIEFYEEIVRKMKFAYDDLNEGMLYVKNQMEIMKRENNKKIIEKEENISFNKRNNNETETIEKLNILNNALDKQIQSHQKYQEESKVTHISEDAEKAYMEPTNFLNDFMNNLYKNVWNDKQEMVFTNEHVEPYNSFPLESNHLGSTRIEEPNFTLQKKEKNREEKYEASSDCTLIISEDENHKENLRWEKRNNQNSSFYKEHQKKETNECSKQDSNLEPLDSLHNLHNSLILTKNTMHKQNDQPQKEVHYETEKNKPKENQPNAINEEYKNNIQTINKTTSFSSYEHEPKSKEETQTTNHENKNKSFTDKNLESKGLETNDTNPSKHIMNPTNITNDSNITLMNEIVNNHMYAEMLRQNIGNSPLNHFAPLNPGVPYFEFYLHNYLAQRELINSKLQMISQMNLQDQNYPNAKNLNHLYMISFLNNLLEKDRHNKKRKNKKIHNKRNGNKDSETYQTSDSEVEENRNHFIQPHLKYQNPLEEFTKKIKTRFSNKIKKEVKNYLQELLSKKKGKGKRQIYKKQIQKKTMKYRKPKKLYMQNRVASFVSYVESFTSTEEQEYNNDAKENYNKKNQIYTTLVKPNPMENFCKIVNGDTLKRNHLESNYFTKGTNPLSRSNLNQKYIENPMRGEAMIQSSEIKKRKRNDIKNTEEKKKERKTKGMIKPKERSTDYSHISEIIHISSHNENTKESFVDSESCVESHRTKPIEQIINLISTEESEYTYISNSCKDDLFNTTSDVSYSQNNKYDLKQLITTSCTQRNVINTVQKKTIQKNKNVREQKEKNQKAKELPTKKKDSKQTVGKTHTNSSETVGTPENVRKWNAVVHHEYNENEFSKDGSNSTLSNNSAFSSIKNSNSSKEYFPSLNEKDTHYFFEEMYPTKYELRSRKQVTYAIPSRKKKLRRNESKPLFDPFAYNNSWKMQI